MTKFLNEQSDKSVASTLTPCSFTCPKDTQKFVPSAAQRAPALLTLHYVPGKSSRFTIFVLLALHQSPLRGQFGRPRRPSTCYSRFVPHQHRRFFLHQLRWSPFMKILLIGCAGFIGSHTLDRLLADGHEVIADV